ncbi:MotE family protein [Roseomonas sp. USHLN139]|uniref:MotE family protein n=1 Tax=Roseomonas sp. USHLN139 TaxID=3081298 RepID=UPI003B01F442
MKRPALPPRSPSWFGPRRGLSLMALGLAALLPGRLDGLPGSWEGLFPARAQAPARPDTAPLAAMPLRDGLVALPHVSPVLAAPVRSNPLGDDRPGEGRLLAEVTRRQAEIDRRERLLEAREARLQATESLARQQIAELARLREEVERLVVRESAASEADIDALVALYVNMRPQQAAKVLERLEPPRAAVILLKIPDRQAGPILAQMEPPAALALTQEIAGRREAFRVIN